MPEQMVAGMTSLCLLRKWINYAVKAASFNCWQSGLCLFLYGYYQPFQIPSVHECNTWAKNKLRIYSWSKYRKEYPRYLWGFWRRLVYINGTKTDNYTKRCIAMRCKLPVWYIFFVKFIRKVYKHPWQSFSEITGNRGVVFATGTPISNSMVEMYSVQRYLQYDTLARNGLQHFDSWASTFGETVTALEIAPELEVHKQIQGEIR